MIKVYIPRDSSALSMGADEVASAISAEALKRKIDIGIVRNGSRGAMWLEPLVEVATAAGRIAATTGVFVTECRPLPTLLASNCRGRIEQRSTGVFF